MASAPKRKRKTIEIQYEEGKERMKVVKLAGKHLQSMGCPVGGGYELWPEEAVFLLETGSGIILKENGAEMTIIEGYSILEKYSISIFKYMIYKYIKSTGLIILRPRESTIRHESNRQLKLRNSRQKAAETPSVSVENEPEEMEEEMEPELCSFPTVVSDRNGLQMRITMLHNDKKLVNFLPDGIMDGFPMRKTIMGLQPFTQNRKRMKPCRQLGIPARFAKSARNWRHFKVLHQREMDKWMSKRRKRFIAPKPEEAKNEQISVEMVDYHVFSPASFSHRLPAIPIFTLICHRSNGPPLDVFRLSQLHNVILAIEEAAKMSFISISGAPVDLTQYFKHK